MEIGRIRSLKLRWTVTDGRTPILLGSRDRRWPDSTRTYLYGETGSRRNFVLWISGFVFGWFLTKIGHIRGLELHWTATRSRNIVPISMACIEEAGQHRHVSEWRA